MTKDAGYTLTETLVALTIVGFSITSLLVAMRVLSQQESRTVSRVSAEQGLQAFDRALGDTLGLGPLVVGDPRRIQIACRPRDCFVDLELSAEGTKAVFDRPDGRFERKLMSSSVTFGFADEGRFSQSWTIPKERDGRNHPPTLIVRDGTRSLVTERTVSPIQPNCTLDPISRQCVAAAR